MCCTQHLDMMFGWYCHKERLTPSCGCTTRTMVWCFQSTTCVSSTAITMSWSRSFSFRADCKVYIWLTRRTVSLLRSVSCLLVRYITAPHSPFTCQMQYIHRGCTWWKKHFLLNNLPPKMAAAFHGLITNAGLMAAGMSYSEEYFAKADDIVVSLHMTSLKWQTESLK